MSYVGITKRDIRRRWRGHVRRSQDSTRRNYLYNAMRKYGKEDFAVEHIACALGEANAFWLEADLIVQEATLHPTGYNLVESGRGNLNPCALSRERMSAGAALGWQAPGRKEEWSTRMQGRVVSDDTKAKLKQAWEGVETRHTPESRRKISEAHKGKKNSPEAREKMRVKATGRKLSEETKEKIRQATLRNWQKNPDSFNSPAAEYHTGKKVRV